MARDEFAAECGSLSPLAGLVTPGPPVTELSQVVAEAGIPIHANQDAKFVEQDQHETEKEMESKEESKPATGQESVPELLAGGRGDPSTTPDTPEISTLRTIAIGATMIATSMTSAMASQVASLGITKISESLDIPTTEQQWLSTSFSIAFGCCLLVSGRLADIFGRKKVYLVGMVSFALWLLISGFMKNKIGMFLSRALCGLSSSLAVPSAMGIVAQTFPPGRRRSIIFAVFGSGFPLGSALGFVMCGLVVGYNWRLVFWDLAALSILPVIGSYFFFPNTNATENVASKLRQIDFLGAFLVTSGLVLLLFSLSYGLNAPEGFATSYIIAGLILSVLLIILFGIWQLYLEKHPSRPCLMKLSLFTRGQGKLAAVYGSATITLMAFVSFGYLSAIFYQEYMGLDPKQTTVRVIPMAISGAACNVLVGMLAPHIKGQIIFALGCVGTALAFLLFAVQSITATYWQYQFPALCLIVFGADFTQSAASIFVSKLVDADEQSVAGGLFQTLTQIGGAIGTTLITLIYTEIAAERDDKATSATPSGSQIGSPYFWDGLRAGCWFGCALATFSLVVVLLTMRGMGYIEEKKSGPPDEERGEKKWYQRAKR